MKKLLLGLATLVSAPLSAQQAAAPAQTAPAAPTAAPVTGPAAPITQAPSAPARPSMTTGSGAITTRAPATTPGEVAAIVAREFPAYDRDRNGALTPPEFETWMVRLKTIADPTLTPQAPHLRTWLGAAFQQADADRSRSVTLAELTGFLSPA
jgi:hypothetical protein